MPKIRSSGNTTFPRLLDIFLPWASQIIPCSKTFCKGKNQLIMSCYKKRHTSLFRIIYLFIHLFTAYLMTSVVDTIQVKCHDCCAVVSPKPGHTDWVQDFDFTSNLFSLLSPWHYSLFLRRIPYRSFWSHPRNRPLVSSRERQSVAAATIPQRFGHHCTCSELKYVECTKCVRVQARTRACEQSV